MQNNRNFLIAMALSIAVLVGWQFLVVSPRMEAQRQAQIAAGNSPGSLQTPQTPAGTPQQSVPAPAGRESIVPSSANTPLPGTATREQALADA
ncbi:MAG: membrane protein insertase YidC, partial [Variovorax sp.]